MRSVILGVVYMVGAILLGAWFWQTFDYLATGVSADFGRGFIAGILLTAIVLSISERSRRGASQEPPNNPSRRAAGLANGAAGLPIPDREVPRRR